MTTESAEHELHEPETVSTSETVNGSHRFNVVGYSLNKGTGPSHCLTSATFIVGGYDWGIRCYLDTERDNETYVSVYLELKSKDKEVKAGFKFTILDQDGFPSIWTYNSTKMCIFGGKDVVWGTTKFVERKTFETSKHLKNDSFKIKCTVTLIRPSRMELVKVEPAMVPPSNLNLQLVHLLESGKGADVNFEVKKDHFKAHKCVLAARSPVLSAQYFGLMSEKEPKDIKHDDIEPEVFRVLLHFIYSDSIPEYVEDDSVMYQHLLVASDQYSLERLKLMCENKLSQNIEMENLAITLTLAEQHSCSILKASCFKFISSPEILARVIETDGFGHLNRSCRFILEEVVENMKRQK